MRRVGLATSNVGARRRRFDGRFRRRDRLLAADDATAVVARNTTPCHERGEAVDGSPRGRPSSGFTMLISDVEPSAFAARWSKPSLLSTNGAGPRLDAKPLQQRSVDLGHERRVAHCVRRPG